MLSKSKQKMLVDFWKKAGNKAWRSALSLYELGHYDHSLFFCHLALEKILKGLVVANTNSLPPHIHDLAKLARLAGLDTDSKIKEKLRVITVFNIAGRYDDEKLAFYKKCTKNYAKKHLEISKKLFLWLKKQYPKK